METKKDRGPGFMDFFNMTPAVHFKEANQLLADAGFCSVPIYSNQYLEKLKTTQGMLGKPNERLDLFIEMLEKAELQNGGEPFIVDVKEADSPQFTSAMDTIKMSPSMLFDF